MDEYSIVELEILRPSSLVENRSFALDVGTSLAFELAAVITSYHHTA
jgi:hypothetical protein